MDIAEQLRVLEAVRDDPAKLALATVDLAYPSWSEGERTKLKETLSVAAVPHWCDQGILAALLEITPEESALRLAQLRKLNVIEPFPARGDSALNVHEATRLVLRKWLDENQPEWFRELSRRTASHFTDERIPSGRIERIYHLFHFAAAEAVTELENLDREWIGSTRPEDLQALAVALKGLPAAQAAFAAGRLSGKSGSEPREISEARSDFRLGDSDPHGDPQNSLTLRQITGTPSSSHSLDRTGVLWLKHALREIIALQLWLGYKGPFETHALLERLHTYIDHQDAEALIALQGSIRFCRYAPSLITRGEIEIFGLAMPRFAIRVYLQDHREDSDEGVAFVNVRRLYEIQPEAEADWAPRVAPPETRLDDFVDFVGSNLAQRPSPASIIRQAVAIADSLLTFNDPDVQWHVLTAPLGSHYGEKLIWGTPYVQINPYSGLCAQGVCFIANALMIEHASGLFGIGEITTMAQSFSNPKNLIPVEEVALQGLSFEQMENYFQAAEVGLNARLQALHPMLEASVSLPHGMLESRWFPQSLRSYLRSGFPVIVPADLEKLISPSGAYEKNRLEGVEARPLTIIKSFNHALCLVGCTRDAENDYFLAHDPIFMPFVEISGEELRESAVASTDEDRRALLCYVPVVPKNVELLLDWDISSNVPRVGLRSLIDSIRKRISVVGRAFYQTLRGDLPVCGSNDAPGQFRLLRMGPAADIFCARLKEFGVPEQWTSAVRQWLNPLCHFAVQFDGLTAEIEDWPWVWVHFDEDYLYIWSAEVPLPVVAGDYDTCLRFACGKSHDNKPAQWSTVFGVFKEVPRQIVPVITRAKDPSGEIELEACLITSFGMNGLKSCLKAWPPGIKNAELYAFMHCDAVELLFPHSGLSTRAGITAHMAAIHRLPLKRRKESCAEIADRIASHFSGGPTIRAIASFLADFTIWSPVRREFIPSEETIAAICFLISLGAHLNARSHQIGVLELAAGSRARGLVYGWYKSTRADGVLLNVPGESKLIRALAQALQRLAPFAGDNGIKLALEMEPGPLHLVNSLDAMSNVLQQTDAEVIGANIDIAHFEFLTRTNVVEVINRLGTSGRIFHAHIAGHSRGHLGDIGLDDLNHYSEGRFDLWLDGLRWLLNQDGRSGTPNFGANYSGLISLEMECPRSTEWVAESARLLLRNLEEQHTHSRLVRT